MEAEKVMKAAYYIDNGWPLKDVLNDSEIDEAIMWLADLLHASGVAIYTEKE